MLSCFVVLLAAILVNPINKVFAFENVFGKLISYIVRFQRNSIVFVINSIRFKCSRSNRQVRRNEFDNQSSFPQNHHISGPHAFVIIIFLSCYYSAPSSFKSSFVWHDISYTE